MRIHPSKLKSWVIKHSSRASNRRPIDSQPPRAQIDSQLLNILPLEIRRQIYDHVLESYGIVQHIVLSDDKLTHMRCVSPTSHPVFQNESTRNNPVCPAYDDVHRKSVHNGWEILPLLMTCRQAYLESIEIIYTSITFRLLIKVATRFIASVPGPSIALANLHLSYSVSYPMYLPYNDWPMAFHTVNINPKVAEAEWEAFWRAFASMRFHELLVEILDQGVRIPEQALLKPLRWVKNGKFEVVLPWPCGLETSGNFEDAEFVVRRPQEPVDLMHLDVEKAYPGPPKGRGTWRRSKR